jgi:hypothetical protein
MNVLKRNGELEKFSLEKFSSSLEKAGFSEAEVEQSLNIIKNSFYDGMSTDEIYEMAWKSLKDLQNFSPVIKYSLKKAILELGPSGFPFEQLVSRIYSELGYQTLNGIMLQGHCIDHEIDILAYNDEELILMEAKFHNEHYMKSDTKVALYVKARFDDLSNIEFEIDGKQRKMTKGILITNTSFTNNSKKYVKCNNTYEMISWSYPKEKGLLHMIEKLKIHPITSIPNLTQRDKKFLIENGCIYCRDLFENKNILDMMKISDSKKSEILKVAESICKSEN